MYSVGKIFIFYRSMYVRTRAWSEALAIKCRYTVYSIGRYIYIPLDIRVAQEPYKKMNCLVQDL